MEPVNDTTSNVQFFQLSNRAYNRLKVFVQIVLPAIGTLYMTLSGIWGLPNVQEVVGTTTAIALFLGTVLGISTRSYKATNDLFDGALEVSLGQNGIKTYSLELYSDPQNLDSKDVVKFKVSS